MYSADDSRNHKDMQSSLSETKRVYVTLDLALRHDYTRKNRFKFYDDESNSQNDISENGKQIAPERQIQEEVEQNVRLMEAILNRQGHCFNPIFDRKTIERIWEKKEDTSKDDDENTADSNIEKDEHDIKFALMGFENKSNIFRAIIKNGIPIIFICPNDTKCEWINVRRGGCEHPEKCMACQQCANGKKYCGVHKSVFVDDTKVAEVAREYQNILQDVYTEQNIGITKIPVFEYSTGIDIIRWFQFYKEYERMHNSRKTRLLANLRASARNLGSSTGQQIRNEAAKEIRNDGQR